jgi:hypothetical protein
MLRLSTCPLVETAWLWVYVDTEGLVSNVTLSEEALLAVLVLFSPRKFGSRAAKAGFNPGSLLMSHQDME